MGGLVKLLIWEKVTADKAQIGCHYWDRHQVMVSLQFTQPSHTYYVFAIASLCWTGDTVIEIKGMD